MKARGAHRGGAPARARTPTASAIAIKGPPVRAPSPGTGIPDRRRTSSGIRPRAGPPARTPVAAATRISVAAGPPRTSPAGDDAAPARPTVSATPQAAHPPSPPRTDPELGTAVPDSGNGEHEMKRVIAVAVFVAAPAAWADEVFLRGGGSIHGEVVEQT